MREREREKGDEGWEEERDAGGEEEMRWQGGAMQAPHVPSVLHSIVGSPSDVAVQTAGDAY